jgi:glycosyltransferase involved in cell wall biosynthesis/folate-dependent phosphoribosylglycinamide formyltransferase PurN
MSLRVVLLTRSGRPSGAQMAWRLFESGYAPVAVVVEKRGRMAGKKKGSVLNLFISWGFRYSCKKIFETLEIKSHYFLRKILKGWFKDPRYLSIEELALDYPVRYYEVEDHNSIDTVRLVEYLNPDVGVLTNSRRICKQMISIPKLGFLNLHLSALPKYGGLESIFWALYHGEKEIGATVHFVAEKIDEGDIVLQEKIPVCRLDDEDSLYDKALWLGTSLMVRALKQVEAGTLKRVPQNLEAASYFSWPIRQERAVLRKLRKIEKLKYDALRLTPFASGPVSGSEPSVPPSDFKRDRRILHFITRMTRGGAQENTLATVRGLRNKGHEVTLLTGPAWGKEGEILTRAIEDKIDLLILPKLFREINLIEDLWVFFRVFAILIGNRYEVIHTHTSKAGFIGRLAGYLCRVPVIIHTPHGHVFHSYFSRWTERFFIRLERWMARWTDRLVALTDACRREHLDLRIGKPEQWVVIPSGVDRDAFRDPGEERRRQIRSELGVPEGKKIAGFVGRLSGIKGSKYFVEAVPKILEAVPSAHFLFVGDGEERPFLEERIGELGMAPHVTFTGQQDDPAALMSMMDVLVVPSLNEGMGRVIVEAGFLKKPVVGTRVGGIPDLLKEDAGILTEPKNPEAIAEAVAKILNDPGSAAQMGERLYARVIGEFTENCMIEKIEQLYKNLC